MVIIQVLCRMILRNTVQVPCHLTIINSNKYNSNKYNNNISNNINNINNNNKVLSLPLLRSQTKVLTQYLGRHHEILPALLHTHKSTRYHFNSSSSNSSMITTPAARTSTPIMLTVVKYPTTIIIQLPPPHPTNWNSRNNNRCNNKSNNSSRKYSVPSLKKAPYWTLTNRLTRPLLPR